jgi:hypothetical protein
MAGLVAGGAKYADMKLDEKQKAEQAERDKKLMELQQKVMEANARFKASLDPDKYQTIEDTDADGRTVKRTIRSGYDDARGGKFSEEVGSAILPEAVKNIDPNSPEGIRARLEFEAGKERISPRRSAGGSSGTGGEALGFEDYETMDPERRALYDRWKGRASSKDQEAADRKWLAAEEQKAIRDFDSTASDRTARRNLLAGFGIDPESPDARKQYAKAYRKDLESRFNPGEQPGAAPMESARAPGQPYPKLGGDSFAPKVDIFSSTTEVVEPERAAPKKDGAKKDATPPDVQALIAQAEQAIQKGADAAKVKARLNEMLKAKGYSIK